ncbi:MAG: alpha/beta hydrolase [Leptospiraceae bacterium]|nr:alpha/beta hydrolase [Leptospiraceae bacterium]MCZ8346403.1 alpha/beta hydrolase [Leptospiraceae bacterium]
MNQEVKNWKDKGNFYQKGNYKTFYFQEGKGDNLLLLHGYPYNSFEWNEIIPELTKKYRLTVLDLLGLGFSDKPQNYKYTFESQCEIIDSLLTELGIHETHIFSHDLGVSVVQELLAREKESKNSFKILSSAFMNGGLFIDVYKPRFIQRLLSQTPSFIGKLLTRFISKKAIEKSVLEVFGPNTKPSQEFLDKQWEILNYNQGLQIAHLIGKMVFDKKYYQDRWIQAMQETSIALVYICGPADPNSGLHMAKRYQELIPNPNVILLSKNIGHWPQVEAPKEVLIAYGDFRSKL